jgi:hypothetical protein
MFEAPESFTTRAVQASWTTVNDRATIHWDVCSFPRLIKKHGNRLFLSFFFFFFFFPLAAASILVIIAMGKAWSVNIYLASSTRSADAALMSRLQSHRPRSRNGAIPFPAAARLTRMPSMVEVFGNNNGYLASVPASRLFNAT